MYISIRLVQQPILVDDNVDYDHDHDHKDVGDNEDDVDVHLKKLVLFDNNYDVNFCNNVASEKPAAGADFFIHNVLRVEGVLINF